MNESELDLIFLRKEISANMTGVEYVDARTCARARARILLKSSFSFQIFTTVTTNINDILENFPHMYLVFFWDIRNGEGIRLDLKT